MKIHLEEEEIHKGIKMYIEHRGFNLKGQEVTIDMSHKKNPVRIFADVEIKDLDSPGKTTDTSDSADTDSATAGDTLANNLFGEGDD